MNKEVILCVDDEFIILFSLKEELAYHYGNRFVYESAGSAHEALDIILDEKSLGNRIALVISDWLMPGMKGDELITRIHESDPEVPFLLITGQMDDDVKKSISMISGFRGFVSKPWDINRIFEMIDTVLPLDKE